MAFDLSVATELQRAFADIIAPFEQYLARAKAPTSASQVGTASASSAKSGMRMGGGPGPAGSSATVSLDHVQTAAAKLNGALAAEGALGPSVGTLPRHLSNEAPLLTFLRRNRLGAGPTNGV
jgi:hypothetical protein